MGGGPFIFRQEIPAMTTDTGHFRIAAGIRHPWLRTDAPDHAIGPQGDGRGK